MRERRAAGVVVAMLLALTGCGGSGTGGLRASAATTSTTAPGSPGTLFPYSEEPRAVDAGRYRIPSSPWSVADFTVTIPQGWTVQYGHVYAKHADTDAEFGFYAVVVDSVFADACAGSEGRVMEIGPTVDDLADALLRQEGPNARGPFDTTLGGRAATRIDLAVPRGFDLAACNVADVGLQVWYSPPADKNFVLVPDDRSSVYIVDVGGRRQVFLAVSGAATVDGDRQELRSVLDSIAIET